MMGSYGKVANGNIAPSRFVKLDTTDTGRVVQCGAGDKVYGVSQPQVHNIALSGGGFSTPDDGYAAAAGEMLNIYGPGDPGVLLEIGSGGCTNGDRLESDVNGKGVTSTVDKHEYGAIALATCSAGQLCPVEVQRGQQSV
jgi:hypothetical protein